MPWRTIRIDTALSVNEAVAVLEHNIGEGRLFQPFGLVRKGATVPFRRAAFFGSSFRPVVEVEVLPGNAKGGGAQIVARMQPIFFVTAFGAFWMIGATIGAAVFMIHAAFGAGGAMEFVLPAALPLSGLAILSGSFASQASWTELLLRKVLPPASPAPAEKGPYRQM